MWAQCVASYFIMLAFQVSMHHIRIIKHSSSDLNLNVLLLMAKLVLWFVMKHSLFSAGPGPIFHSSSFLSFNFFKFFVNIEWLFFHCVFGKSSKRVNLFLGWMIRAFGVLSFTIFASFLCFSASFFKVQNCSVLCVDFSHATCRNASCLCRCCYDGISCCLFPVRASYLTYRSWLDRPMQTPGAHRNLESLSRFRP